MFNGKFMENPLGHVQWKTVNVYQWVNPGQTSPAWTRCPNTAMIAFPRANAPT